MNSRKKNIIENLKATNTDLRNILIDLKMENKECQFDYCTNSELANKVCELENICKQINKIVFQK